MEFDDLAALVKTEKQNIHQLLGFENTNESLDDNHVYIHTEDCEEVLAIINGMNGEVFRTYEAR